MPKKDIRSWLAKQVIWQVHIPPPKEIHNPHYDVTKPNEQHQFDLLYVSYNLFEGNTYKYILTGIDVASRYKVARALRSKNQAKLHLCWKQYIKREACSNIPDYFNVIMVQSLKMKWQSCLKNTTLMFKEQQRNTSIPIRPLWKPLTKSWQNCCLNQWVPKSFKTLKKFPKFRLKI